MRQPSCVLWALTKHNSAFKRQHKGMKSRLDCFSADPLNNTGMHNASSAGFTVENAIGLAAKKGESKSKKGFRREYELRVGHKSYHHTNKRVLGNASAGLSHSTQTIRRGTSHAAKSIQGLTFVTSAKKQMLLKRLGRLHAATRDLVKNAPSAKK